jgi:UDP-N-acetylglucosamine 1-carboxyvinyltransferase
MTQANGPSVISEALYENRFRHVEFLQQMGAHIAIDGRSAVINGPARLHGTRMSIPDIRSGAALVIAGLCAEGTTELDRVFHLERGYDDLETKLAGLGADIERVVTDEPGTEVRDLTGVVGD